jgi:hypothetical protein
MATRSTAAPSAGEVISELEQLTGSKSAVTASTGAIGAKNISKIPRLDHRDAATERSREGRDYREEAGVGCADERDRVALLAASQPTL